jgi:hypothetical protein
MDVDERVRFDIVGLKHLGDAVHRYQCAFG